jgi:hypothetical protein
VQCSVALNSRRISRRMASPFLVINRTMQTLAVPVDTTRKQSSRGNGLESPLIQSFIVQAQLPVICRSLVS